MKFKDMPKLPLVLAAAMFVVGAIVYPSLPATVPVHWGPSGQIDAWAAKSLLSVFFAPLVLLAIYLLLWFVPYLDPKRGNLIRSKQVYGIAIELLAGMMTIVFLGTLLASFNHALPMSSIIEVATGIMFIVLGNYMGRVKRNWTMGFRYGWTLSDDTVWVKTNRLGGRLFMIAGVFAVIGAFLPPMVGIAFILLPALVMLPVTYVYSMLLYKRLHPEEMEPPEPPDDLGEDDPADKPVPPPATLPSAHPVRVEVECPACGADNAPGNGECIRCGKALPAR